ncbi:DUF4181 domain-containing protein [Planococcus maritimus]|uniref:DUF4181 domain-containing protein n=1 Tax=Planococcus maritimus TaxID=192421 RepID=UPI0007985AC1|nr:DUF4181 domain-containing protein [Planococcus maritimus]KYG60112.1 hypothetical protein AY633_07755 [Planococcus maritimus]
MEETAYFTSPFEWMLGLPAFFVVSWLAIFCINWILRKILGVERKKWFSSDGYFVNEFHEKVERYFRYGSVALYIVFLLVFGFEQGSIYFVLFTFLLSAPQELFKAFLEKKHAKNPNDYKFTLLEYPVSIVIFLTCAMTFTPDIFNLFMDELSSIFSN